MASTTTNVNSYHLTERQTNNHDKNVEDFSKRSESATVMRKASAAGNQQKDLLGSSKRRDSLEFYIKFPTCVLNKSGQLICASPPDDNVIVFNDIHVPIVMLLGWAGCQDRYLMKYSKIYEDRGLMTMRYTAPVDTLFWRRSEMIPIGEKILKLVQDMNMHCHPIILHIFSNGGAYLYQHISLAIRRNKTPLRIRGMIIDSAPGERRILGLYRAVTAIYGRERKKCHCLTAVIITLTLSFMWFAEEAYSAFKSLFVKTEPIQTNPFNDLKNEPNEFPQLFLYSKGDAVIPYSDIEKFIKIRQEQGVEVNSICFEDAEHVKIFTKYPTKYVQYVCSFINKCLASPYRAESFVSTPNSTNSMSSSSFKYD
uniref:Transmembrane protein 53 n=1 Tax=Glossina brevipalpis TaxID=37001 RepID=A0A1A9WES0_9MUSC